MRILYYCLASDTFGGVRVINNTCNLLADRMERVEYAGGSSELIKPQTPEEHIDTLIRFAYLRGNTPLGCKGSLKFYGRMIQKYKQLLLEQLK